MTRDMLEKKLRKHAILDVFTSSHSELREGTMTEGTPVTDARGRAVARLRTAMKAAAAGNGRLPTIAELAESAGVSPKTMARVVRQFVLAGTLTSAPRSGIHVVAEPRAELAPPARSRSLCQRVAAQLAESLHTVPFDNRHSHTRVKAIAERYGISRPTARKVQRLVEATGLLVQGGVRERSGVVHIVLVGDERNNPEFFVERTRRQFQSIMGHITRAGVRPVLRVFNYRTQRIGSAVTSAAAGPVLGAVVMDAGMPQSQVLLTAREHLEQRLPVAVIDELGLDARAVSQLPRRGLRVLRLPATDQPGRDVGVHLWERGHRRVAFISTSHGNVFSQARLRGLRRVFTGPDDVTALVRDTPFPRSPEHESLRQAVSRGVARVLNEHVRLGDPMYEYELTEIRGEAGLVVDRMFEREWVWPLCEQALSHDDITAVVCVRDVVAIECLAFMRMNGVPVPQRISVVGFDDSLKAMASRLTSYQFNADGFAQAASEFVLGARQGDYLDRTPVQVTVPGAVIQRETSARACTA